MKRFLLLLFAIVPIVIKSQPNISKYYYTDACDDIVSILSGIDTLDFSYAVFASENAYCENKLSIESFYNILGYYTSICRGIAQSGDIEYSEKDKANRLKLPSITKMPKGEVNISK